jgi:hypothetical protein
VDRLGRHGRAGDRKGGGGHPFAVVGDRRSAKPLAPMAPSPPDPGAGTDPLGLGLASIMRRLLSIALAAVSLSGRSAAADAINVAESQKAIGLERVTVTASKLDLSPDPSVDYIVPKLQIVYEYLGHDIPGNEIMQAEGLQDLKDNWRPRYGSLDKFVSGVSHQGWKVAAKRDLKDFYLAVFATPHGNIAGEYYAKTREGMALQSRMKILLFVSDRSFKQIVPDSEVFTLEQRMRYSVSVGEAHGLMPANFHDVPSEAPATASSPPLTHGVTFSGWLIFHQGDLFIMPSSVKNFFFVFKGGATDGDSVVLAFTNWSRN